MPRFLENRVPCDAHFSPVLILEMKPYVNEKEHVRAPYPELSGSTVPESKEEDSPLGREVEEEQPALGGQNWAGGPEAGVCF